MINMYILVNCLQLCIVIVCNSK